MALFRPKTKLGNLWITRRRWDIEQSNVTECWRQERERERESPRARKVEDSCWTGSDVGALTCGCSSPLLFLGGGGHIAKIQCCYAFPQHTSAHLLIPLSQRGQPQTQHRGKNQCNAMMLCTTHLTMSQR